MVRGQAASPGKLRLLFLLVMLITLSAFHLVGQSVTVRGVVLPDTMGPGTGSILIHQFPDQLQEAAAFESGVIDIMDSVPPAPYLEAWNGAAVDSRSIITQGKVAVSNSFSGRFEIDLNSYRWPTNDGTFRQALSYMLDRQALSLMAQNRLLPLCSMILDGFPGGKNCAALGFPTTYGDFNPEKGVQILYENGWRDNDNDGLLEGPNGTEPVLEFYIRSDDSRRREAGLFFASQLENLPKSFTSMAGGIVTVCESTNVCAISVNEYVVPRVQVANIVFYGPPWDDWHMYTGGWSAFTGPDALAFLYGSDFANTRCGGGWMGYFPLNYPCYVDPEFDALAFLMITGPTYDDVIAVAHAAQDYLWGYDRNSGRVAGTMPVIPTYSIMAERVSWVTDQGEGAIMNPDGTRACWKGFVDWLNFEDIPHTLTGLTPDNCRTGPGYQSYRGAGTIDWGFGTTVQGLNVVTSQLRWDLLAMRHTYESLLARSPSDSTVFIPVLAEGWGEGVYRKATNWDATVAVYKFRDGVRFSDGRYATALDFKFSAEYVHCNFASNFPLVERILDTDYTPCDGLDGIIVTGADPVNGIGGTVHVYFEEVGAFFTQNAALLPIIPRHVWCASWPIRATDCAYPDPDLFPRFDFTKLVGTGSHIIAACTGTNCSGTLTLLPNPYYRDGTRYWNRAAGISLQPDVNRDDYVDSKDLALLTEVSPSDIRFDVDYRRADKQTVSFSNSFGTGNVSITLRGPVIDSGDRYIVSRLIFEGSRAGAPLSWPPTQSLTHVWPDTDRDNSVNLEDLIGVYIHQLQATVPVSENSIFDVDYDADVDLDDLIIVFVRQFTRPVGL